MDWKDAAAQMEKNGTPANIMGYCMIAFDLGRQSGIDSVAALPHRAMFDSGVDAGRKEAAAEIIKYIAAQGTIEVADGEEQCYYIIDDDLKIIRGKFGVEI